MVAETIHRLKEELPSNVELVAVSKFHPVEAIRQAYDAGQRVFAESRPQELASKVPQLPSDIRWHFIGHLQTNKLKMVLPYASMVESVDSLHLLDAIENWCGNNRKTMDVLLEYHVAEEETKQGFSREEITEILTSPEEYPHVCFRGLMGMATFTDDRQMIRSEFMKIKELRDSLISAYGDLPKLSRGFDRLSFGMSHDYGIAIECGSNMVRIGTLIFGERAY